MYEASWSLIAYEEVDLFTVAMSVGYEHYATFYRAFRRQAGCTPSSFRDRVVTASVENAGTPRLRRAASSAGLRSVTQWNLPPESGRPFLSNAA